MRKLMALMLGALLLCLPALSLAESAAPLILTGKVEAQDTQTLYAPFSGTVKAFTLDAGDRVAQGDTLMTLDTIKVYAPVDGIVRGIFAQPGDTTAFIQGKYGALCYIEPDISMLVPATTAQAYNDEENRTIHVGEHVYLQATNNTSRQGEGRVIAVSGENYSLEVLSGNLDLRDSVNIFRESDFENESRIGRGVVMRADPMPISAEGTVLSVAVRDGAHVRRGDLLFELIGSMLDDMNDIPNTAVRAPEDAVVANVAVSGGQTASKNQPLVTLHLLDTLRLSTTVSEMDLQRVQIGDTVRLTFDSIADKTYEGTVASISGIGTPSDQYTVYAVTIVFTPDENVRIGMSGTAYLD